MNYHYLEIVLNTHSQHIFEYVFFSVFCEWKVNFEWNNEDKMYETVNTMISQYNKKQ